MTFPKRAARAGLIALALALASPAAANDIQGKVQYVYDGDTIRVRGVKIRLNGLHAPEGGMPGGAQATRFMRNHYGGKVLRCRLNGDRTYDRLVGICWGPDGEDIAAALVAAGLGRDCPRYSGGRYRRFETRASRALPLPRYC